MFFLLVFLLRNIDRNENGLLVPHAFDSDTEELLYFRWLEEAKSELSLQESTCPLKVLHSRVGPGQKGQSPGCDLESVSSLPSLLPLLHTISSLSLPCHFCFFIGDIQPWINPLNHEPKQTTTSLSYEYWVFSPSDRKVTDS